jgi:hypothetical protein
MLSALAVVRYVTASKGDVEQGSPTLQWSLRFCCPRDIYTEVFKGYPQATQQHALRL